MGQFVWTNHHVEDRFHPEFARLLLEFARTCKYFVLKAFRDFSRSRCNINANPLPGAFPGDLMGKPLDQVVGSVDLILLTHAENEFPDVDAEFGVYVAGAHLEIGWDEEEFELVQPSLTERTQKLQLYTTAQAAEAKLGIVDIEGKESVKPGEGSLVEFKMRSKTDSVDLTSLQIKQAILVDPSARKLDVKILGKAEDVNLPKQFSLSQNFPNPFNPTTVIKYALPLACEVQITVYNILGQRVRTLVDKRQDAGYKRIEWDSKNEAGHEVASGIYFYRIKAGKFADSKKMVILK